VIGAPVKHQVGEHCFAWIVHLTPPGARCKDVAQFGQGNVGAVLGYQAGFIEPSRTTALVALDPHHIVGVVREGEGDLHLLRPGRIDARSAEVLRKGIGVADFCKAPAGG